MQGNRLGESARDPASATRRYEDFKCSHLDTKEACQAEGITFVPMVVEAVGGGWGSEACTVWTELAKTSALASGELPSCAAVHLLQSLSITLHRENARAVLRRIVNSSNLSKLHACTLAAT